tara:strand:+ start:139 stop:660 length:522 start_codon:yes stop_codon:yes gene_type:complete
MKIGMLPSRKLGGVLANALQAFPDLPVVLDPVLASSSGLSLMDEECIGWVRDEFMSHLTLVTPNLEEARQFTGIQCDSRDDVERAGEAFISLGARAVLVKGGHLPSDTAADYLITSQGNSNWIESPRVDGAFRGTGCRLSSAVATRLGKGADLSDAVAAAKGYLTDCLQQRTG